MTHLHRRQPDVSRALRRRQPVTLARPLRSGYNERLRNPSRRPKALEGGSMATETATQAITGNTYQLLINGEFVASKSGETFERRNPANGDVVATCPKATEEDTDAAIRAARAAF